MNVIREFVPIIERNGGGAILNVLSVLSWSHPPTSGAYSSAKAAAWALTDAVRTEVAPRGIHVAAASIGGLFAGQAEILADEASRKAKVQLSSANVDR